MGTINTPLRLNLGCGTNKLDGFVNIDAYGDPDGIWDLNVMPYPWMSNTVDEIVMNHVLEHVEEWWECFRECARILKPGGTMYINVPDESSKTALTYRDHHHVFSLISFHGIQGRAAGTNAWAASETDSVPLVLDDYRQVPHKQYYWMIKWCPWLLKFCADHLRNFIHEQRFVFRKIGERDE